MSNTATKAEKEFEILEQLSTEDNKYTVLEFKDEILALVDKFGNSGQSGGSAPFTAQAISNTVKKLCLQEPITPLTGEDSEWFFHDTVGDGNCYQNNRLGSVFKTTKDSKAYYLDAIIFQGEDDYDTFSGKVDGICSRQYIKSFPFTPKKFFVDVFREPLPEDWTEEPFYENTIYDTKEFEETGVKNWKKEKYRYLIKNKERVLKEVFEYYDEYRLEKSMKFETMGIETLNIIKEAYEVIIAKSTLSDMHTESHRKLLDKLADIIREYDHQYFIDDISEEE